jgi:lysyl-tRNA synthetase class 2
VSEQPDDVGKREAELKAARRTNLAALRERNADPFLTTRYDVTAHAADVVGLNSERTVDDAPSEETFGLAGRIMALRKMGKDVYFADLWDRSGKLQIYVRRDAVGDDQFARFDYIDIGDIVGVHGRVFRTKTGELTLRAESLQVLTKSFTPLPDKWHGLVDVEKRYRQRYVDLIMNEEVRKTFLTRSAIVSNLRRFLDERHFIECETPTMLPIAGGAAARPFRTHHNALDIDLDLRIATELALKRLIVGGLERVYEIGRIWRNEGIDTRHNPEFTMLELYAAYWSWREMMDFNEEMLSYIITKTLGTDSVVWEDKTISFARPFRRVAYFDAMHDWGGLERSRLLDEAETQKIIASMDLPPSPTHGHALDKIFDRVIEPRLVDPTFVFDYPTVISPLSKRKPGDPDVVERYELFAANFELINAFSELNDPDDQRHRFVMQQVERAKGDADVPPPDWDFVNALEYGMPPTAGMGMGVDRLVMLLLNKQSIREVILFPLQRPQA